MPSFLADESCDFGVVRGLRSAGSDVEATVENMPGADDEVVLSAAASENRVLLTEDKDFGEWVFAHKAAAAGVVLIRYPSSIRTTIAQTMVELVSQSGDELFGKFTVLEPGRARIRSIVRE